MTTLADLLATVRRKANDEKVTYRWSDELIKDGIHEGLTALAEYAGAVTPYTFTATEDDTEYITMPTNFIRLISIAPYTTDRFDDFDDDAFFVIGNLIYLQVDIDTTEEISMIYEATWPVPVDDDDDVDIPFWAGAAVADYAIYYSLQQEGVKQSIEGFYKDRVDSGSPVQIPALLGCDWYLKQFTERCLRHIRHEVVSGSGQG